MKPIRLELQDDKGNPIDDVIIEDRPDVGPEIRTRGQAQMLAGDRTTVDLDHCHCAGCRADKTIGDLLGLTEWELEAICAWRERLTTRPQDREVSSRQMGEILDKIVSGLEKDAPDCDTVYERITLKVEHE